MTKLPARRWLVCGLLWMAGCGPVIEPEDDGRGACPQTGEFGNIGCARIVVMVQGPQEPWPALYRWHVLATPARERTGVDGSFAARPDTGAVPLQLTRWHRDLVGSGDSVSVWVHARLLDDVRRSSPACRCRYSPRTACCTSHALRPSASIRRWIPSGSRSSATDGLHAAAPKGDGARAAHHRHRHPLTNDGT